MKRMDMEYVNLLEDRDFVDYYWTLPFTVL